MTTPFPLFSSWFDGESLIQLISSYGLHLVMLVILIFGIYYTTFRRKNFVFTFFIIGTVVFFLSYVMSKLNLNAGFGLGLFAIFGIIRYRTDLVPIREMTYLFIIIGLSVLNGVTKHALSFAEALTLNALILATVFIFEKLLNLRNESFKLITYERTELLQPGLENELLKDIREKTGFNIERVEVIKYNYTKNNALIKAYYHSKKAENGSFDSDYLANDADDD